MMLIGGRDKLHSLRHQQKEEAFTICGRFRGHVLLVSL